MNWCLGNDIVSQLFVLKIKDGGGSINVLCKSFHT